MKVFGIDIRKIMVLSILCLGLAACGGGDATTSAAVDPNAPVDTTATDPALAANPAATDPNASATGAAPDGVVTELPDTSDGGVVFDSALGVPGQAFKPLTEVDDAADGTGGTTGTTTAKTKTTWRYDYAYVTVDGKSYKVSVGSTFPTKTQQFSVQSLAASSIVITLTAGEFSSGEDGYTLAVGHTYTLLNSSQAIDYRVRVTKVHGIKTVTTIASDTDTVAAPAY